MSRMMCIPCNVEFPSSGVFLEHKRSGHTNMDQATPLDAPPIPTPPPGVPAEAMPSKEFMETIARIESKKEEKPISDDSRASQHPSELPVAQPLMLTYKWVGECSEHRCPVDTLELDVATMHFCIAYCPTGKHQIQNKEVEKI